MAKPEVLERNEIAQLSHSAAKDYIDKLRREIRRHDYLYYVKDKPEISDDAYDQLFATLKRLEERFPDLITADSPTQRVGGKPQEQFRVVEHTAPMLSLDATREEAEVQRFDERIKSLSREPRYVLEEKFDGASLELVYEDGILARAVTRGDGREGEDVTENVKTIRPLPLRLRGNNHKAPKLLAVRGEVMIKIAAFEALNRKLLESGREPFANPRNAAAGSLRQLDPRITAQRPLDVVVYEVMAIKGASFSKDSQALKSLEEWGLPVPKKILTVSSLSEIIKRHAELAEARDRLAYEIDGVVIKLDDLSARKRLGSTTHHPRWAIAYKFAPRGEVTRIEQIAVQVGRTGVLTPVALMRPVELGGVTISRATLHNRRELERKDIRPGDLVRIQRAGDVIPEVVERIVESKRREPPFKMPTKCPACGSSIIERGPYTVCPNRFGCPAQLKGRVKHFASREALDIEGLGDETVAALIDHGFVRDLADLFRLKKNHLLELEGFAERSAEKMIGAIQKRRRVELGRFLYALGIPEVGRAVARDLALQFRSLESIRRASREEFEKISGMGPKMSQAVVDFFSDKRNQRAIDALLKAGLEIIETKRPQKQPLSGKTFVFTGALERFSRSEAQRLVESIGGNVATTVSTQTDYVVAGSEPGTKFAQAKSKGVKTLSESEFINLLRDAGADV